MQKYDYDAFGNELEVVGFSKENDTNPFRYCGEYFDEETESVYLRARYYSPGIGRFSQEDSYWNPSNMVYGANGRLSIHNAIQIRSLYVYCGNNPIAFTDLGGQRYDEGAVNDHVNVANGDFDSIEPIPGDSTYVEPEPEDNNYVETPTIENTGTNKTFSHFDASSLPKKGKPNSVGRLYNPDGSLKQERKYGPDGQPVLDRDYNHGGTNHEFPHDHEWVDGERQAGVPVPEDSGNLTEAIIGAAAAAGTAYVIGRAIRLLPSLLPPLWPTIPINVLAP